MNDGRCCEHSSKPASPLRRGGEAAGWIIPGITLALMPKCPACVAMYVALFSGASISVAGVAWLRMTLLALSVIALFCMAVWRLRRARP